MSVEKVMKKLRKEMRRDLNEKYRDFRDHMREKPWWERLCICAELLFRP